MSPLKHATLAIALRYVSCAKGRGKATLKITTHEGPKAATLQLEGSVTGPWVSEFQHAWRSVAASLGSRKFSIDLRGVTQMNSDARELLAEIYKKTGAEFIANTPMIKYFAEEAQHRNRKNI